MTSKREIRLLRRENVKLNEENRILIKKTRDLHNDNRYFSRFIDLIINLVNEVEPEHEPPRRHIKLFH